MIVEIVLVTIILQKKKTSAKIHCKKMCFFEYCRFSQYNSVGDGVVGWDLVCKDLKEVPL